jgi:hypothetical protein
MHVRFVRAALSNDDEEVAMGTICVLKPTNAGTRLAEQDREGAGARPVSLLAFLQAENLKLQTAIAELERDTTALREELRVTEAVSAGCFARRVGDLRP